MIIAVLLTNNTHRLKAISIHWYNQWSDRCYFFFGLVYSCYLNQMRAHFFSTAQTYPNLTVNYPIYPVTKSNLLSIYLHWNDSIEMNAHLWPSHLSLCLSLCENWTFGLIEIERNCVERVSIDFCRFSFLSVQGNDAMKWKLTWTNAIMRIIR